MYTAEKIHTLDLVTMKQPKDEDWGEDTGKEDEDFDEQDSLESYNFDYIF